jgi:hypothetical protein
MATTVRIQPAAEEPLKRLKTALESEEGHKATQEEIVAALVWGTTAAQAAGMLLAFTRETAE